MSPSNTPAGRAITRAAARVQRATVYIPATLCTATGNITPGLSARVSARSVYVWVRMPDGVSKAFNNKVSPTTGLRVYVGYAPPNWRRLSVLDTNDSYNDPLTGNAYGPHHATHEAPAGGDIVYSQARQFMPLRVSVISGFVVKIEASPLAVVSGYDLSPTTHLDLSGDVPTIGARYVLLYLDAAGIFSKRLGANVGAFGSLHYSNIPATLAGEVPLAAMSLYQGQTSIHETLAQQDVVDLRFAGSSSAASLSDATPTTVGVVEIDESPPSGHPVALTLSERGKPNGLASVDTDHMLSSMYLPLIGGQATGAVSEVSRWVRSPSNPLFGGVFDNGALEPNVIIEDGIFKMWYTAGWFTPQLNYATSPDGITWTDYGSNPVLGNGGSGYAGTFVAHDGFVKLDGVYYLYFADGSFGNLMRSTSLDGIVWTAPVLSIANNAYAWSVGWANNYVWREGYTWYMILETRVTTAQTWRLALFSSTDGLNWTVLSGTFLTSLEPAGVGGASGPWMMTPQKRNGVYHLWYHGTTTAATVPGKIFHATSTDLLNWTITNSGNPILSPTGISPEIDQVADPCVVEWNNKTYLYFEGVDNGSALNKIEVLTWDGTIAQLLDGAADSAGGTVSSVALTAPAEFSVAGSPVTASGTLALSKANQSSNTVWAGPTSGIPDVPTFRDLVLDDLPAGIGTVHAPLVNGDLPGPTPIATDDGQFIMAPVS